MRKKQIWRAVYKNNIRNYEQCRPSKNEKAIKLTKLQNFKYERLDLRIYEDYVTATIFTLMLLNGLLVLVSPNV